MRLKTLEMSGFKSFGDRTIITFEEGVTGIVGPNGCGKCVHGDTKVTLADGSQVAIRALVEDAFANAETVQQMDDGEYTYDNSLGVEVVSLDTHTLKMERRPVLAFVRRTSPKNLLKVTVRSGRTITATEYHPFFIHEDGKIRAIRADELRSGIYVAAPRVLPVEATRTHFAAIADSSSEKSELIAVDNMLMSASIRTKPLWVKTKLTKEWGRFLGYVISEGQNSLWSDQVRFVNSDARVIEDYCKSVNSLFQREPVRKNYKKNSSAEDVLLYSSILCDMLERSFGIKRGGHSSTKKVPALVFEAPDEVVLEFLSALIEGDGCVRIDRSKSAHKGTTYVEYATASRELAEGVATILLRFGVRSLIREKQKKATNADGPKRTYYSVYVYGAENLRTLALRLNLVSSKKDLLLEASCVAEPAATVDVIPNATELFGKLWNSVDVSIKKSHPLRGRIESYREDRCNPSRKGISEAIQYVRENSLKWTDENEAIFAKIKDLSESDIYWDEVVSVENVVGDEWVYDLCVEKDHNFVANDLVVHNSNVVDAIRWVMGEMSAKHLRGLAMEDVIFNGCESRPPVGMSQVFLTFDNSDGRAPADYAQYSEIQVGRRLYRSGESEYFINKTPCRLRDIIDLFLGTGVGSKAYSIVEQGMVGAIVSSKPEERRIIIEEAAGISKFKSRKEAALRKMDSTRLNLARLSDIQAELTRQINSLNRQAKKAERYQRVSDELRGRELALCATRHRQMRGDLEGFTKEHDLLREKEAGFMAQLSGVENELETRRLELTELERELDGVQQDLYRAQNSIKLCEAEIVHRTKEREQLGKQSQDWAGEVEDLKVKTRELSVLIDNANSEMVRADLKLADSSSSALSHESVVNALHSEFNELQTHCNELNSKVVSGGGNISNLNASLEHFEHNHIDITGRIAKNQAEIDAVDKRREEITKEIAHYENDLGSSKQLKLSIANEYETTVATLASQKEALLESEKQLSVLRDEIGDRRARLKSLKELRENLEGYRDGVRSVLSRVDSTGEKMTGVMGTVSEFVETDPQYEPALGAVLGDRLQYVVVKSHEEGVNAIDYLKTAATGRSSFIPMNIRASTAAREEPSGEGVVGPLMNFVRFDNDYRHICSHLLGDVVLVDDLKRALDLWVNGNYTKTFVTRDGSVVDPSGVVTGGAGSGVEEQLIAQKRRMKELEVELGDLGPKLAAVEGEALKLRDNVKTIEEQVECLRRDGHSKELQLVAKDRDLARLKDENVRYERERDKLAIEIAALSEEIAEIENEKKSAKQRIIETAGLLKNTEEELVNARAELESKQLALTEKEQVLIDFKVDLAKSKERQELVARELIGLVRSKSESALQIDRRFSDISLSSKRQLLMGREIESLKLDLDLALRSVGRLEESKTQLSARYESESNELHEKEASIRQVRKQHDEALAGYHSVEIKLTEHKGKMRYLSDGIRERYHLDLASIEDEYAREDLDLETEEVEVGELKEKVDSIGPVNIDAIKEFEELSKRHEFLSKQVVDLEASLENLSKAIAKINRTSRLRFRRAFDAVDEQFKMLFPKLFRGGQARLMLTDEENLLETGVEIIAQPPGKKLQSITLLSGGEKALTAVALIFSIFLIKPSPFCLLDEVDAPLDDANIDRFNDLIRSMTPHSQFILITHNKRTMELADLLYGVTMEEAGVSKMVSVKLGVDKDENEAAPQVA